MKLVGVDPGEQVLSAVSKGAHSGVRSLPLRGRPQRGDWSTADTCGRMEGGIQEFANDRKPALFYYYSSMSCGRSLFVMPNYNVRRDGALVESITFNPRIVGLILALAYT